MPTIIGFDGAYFANLRIPEVLQTIPKKNRNPRNIF